MANHGLPSRTARSLHNLIQLDVRGAPRDALILEQRDLYVFYSGDMPELDYKTRETQDETMIAVHMIARLNMVNDVAEIIRFGRPGSRPQDREKQAREPGSAARITAD
jgi:hypothetical protein